MHRRLFTVVSAASLAMCVGTGIACVLTARVSLYNPRPELTLEPTMPWLGWLSAAFAAATVGLLLRQAARIRRADDRARVGLCTACGYDLRATPGRCPECGAVAR